MAGNFRQQGAWIGSDIFKGMPDDFFHDRRQGKTVQVFKGRPRGALFFQPQRGYGRCALGLGYDQPDLQPKVGEDVLDLTR